ncbi:tyrosine-type recombinase/integrase [Brachybacterium sp. JHP9]|uniref:Tyrosine-type recombinase/integrase n=1 Tax=Brachybacterium equifaecis TaxID=2910770 RepID=A0ABT0R3K4_9MICO|nr:tyrosine-type recombinase/integrase [Brachybacterium equifaecis]
MNHEIQIDGRWVSEDRARETGVPIVRGLERRAWVRFRGQDGTSRRLYARGKTRAACATQVAMRVAEAKAADDAAQRLRGRRGHVLEYVDAYLVAMDQGRLPRTYALRTMEAYHRAVDGYLRGTELAGMSVDDVTRNTLMDALRLMPRGTRAHMVAVLGGAWRIADGDVAGTPPPSPLIGLAIPRDPSPKESSDRGRERREIVDAGRDRAHSDAELAKMLEKLDADDAAVRSGARDLIALAEQTGARITELVSVRWEDVDLDASTPLIRIRGQVVRVRGEGLVWTDRVKSRLSRREVPLTEAAAAVLRRRRELHEKWRAAGPVDEDGARFVFAAARVPHGMPDVDVYKKSVRRAFDAAGHPEMTIHSMRRAVARRLESAGLPRMDVESILGQTEEVRKRHYSTHGIPERGIEALSRAAASYAKHAL